jgi:hypothetical protein
MPDEERYPLGLRRIHNHQFLRRSSKHHRNCSKSKLDAAATVVDREHQTRTTSP